MSPDRLKNLLIPVAMVAAVAAFQYFDRPESSATADRTAVATSDSGSLVRAYESRAQDVWVEGQGQVVKVLPDDNKGSRHQRFIIRTEFGPTILIAHNIDLAPRVEPLAVGARVTFRGEYVWNDRGGVLHWTHHDPQGRHAGGWIRSGGQTFE